MKKAFSALVVLLSLFGCARVQIVENGRGDGYDVFRPEPYLLVYREKTKKTSSTSGGPVLEGGPSAGGGSGGQNSGGSQQPSDSTASGSAASAAEGIATPGMVVVWLPNYGHRYRIRTTAGFMKAGAQFSIRDGWMLNGFSDQSDNTALITTAQALLSGGTAAATGGASKAAGMSVKSNAGSNETVETEQTFDVYKFVFNEKGEFYGLAQVDFAEKWSDIYRNKMPPRSPLSIPGMKAPNEPILSN